MIHEIELTGYDVTYLGDGTLTLGTWDSHGIEKLHITADGDWDGLTVKATFRIGSTSVKAIIDAYGTIEVPPEATSKAGSGVIVFSGTDGEMLRVSRNLKYKVLDHDPIDGDESQPTPSEFEQFVSQVNDARIDAQQAAVESAKNSTAAAQSAQTAEKASSNARSSADLAQAVASSVGAAQEAAQQSARAAESQANASGSQAALAAQSAQAAEQSNQAAQRQADQAGQKSEEAETSASAAADSAREAQVQAEQAWSSARDAASHNEAAAVSAQAAAASAGNAAESCARAESAAEQAAGSAVQAANSAQDSASHADRAQAAADRAEQVADFDPSDFATAEQGTRADSAVQSVNGKSGSSITLQAGDIGAATADQGGRADTAVQTVNLIKPDGDGNVQLSAANVGAATAAQGALADSAVQQEDLVPYAKRSEIPGELPCPQSLNIRLGQYGTTTSYDGSLAKSVVITPASIDAATAEQGIQLYIHSRQGTVHNFAGQGVNGRAKVTADFNAGDTVQLNGVPVTATCGADPVDGDTIVNGQWVSFVADAEGGQINFKGGGGLGNTKLAQATAEPSDVISGETFYAGDKGLKTGTIVDHTGTTNANSVRSSGGNFYAAIPYGAYRQNSGNGYPEIKFTHTLSVKDQLTSSDDTNTTSKTFTLKNAIPFGFLCISSARNIADGRTIKITSVTSASGTCTKIYSSLVFGYSDNGAFVGVWMLKNIPANTKITIKGDGFAYSFNAATFTVK